MSAEPTISLQSVAKMTPTAFNQQGKKISYLLYADEYYFANWTDWVNDSSNSPNFNQKQNASKYENYVWKMECELVQVNNACGFLHPKHGAYWILANKEGEIAAVADVSTAVSNTVTMTKAQYDIWNGQYKAATVDVKEVIRPKLDGNCSVKSADGKTTTTVACANVVSNTSIADPYFQFFYCGGSRDFKFTCYKYQQIVSENGSPRFDTKTSGA